MTGLQGKVAMITGCGGERGLGRGIARRLADDGPIWCSPTSLRRARRFSPPSRSAGGAASPPLPPRQALGRRAIVGLLDIRSARQIDDVIAEALAAFGRIDILVNNAAAPPGADRVPVVDLPEAAWDTVLDTNLKGAFLVSKAVARTMLQRNLHGRIVNIASDRAKVGTANLAAYCASKFGLVGFTQSLAMELAPAGITVNAVCPGGVDSERLDYLGRRTDGTYDEEARAAEIRRREALNPLGRLTRPEDVAEVVAFLASDGAEYLTGQAINVTGGSVMH